MTIILSKTFNFFKLESFQLPKHKSNISMLCTVLFNDLQNYQSITKDFLGGIIEEERLEWKTFKHHALFNLLILKFIDKYYRNELWESFHIM